MVDFILAFGITSIIAFGALAAWGMHCSEKTFQQRSKYISRMFEIYDPEVLDRYLVAFDDVSFGQHSFALCTFRNPLKLYSKEFQELMTSTGGINRRCFS